MTTERVSAGGLRVARVLHDFVRREALPGSGVDEAAFWAGLEAILDEFVPRNRALLATRDELQAKLDEFHAAAPGPVDQAAYEAFLREIGYLVDEPADVTVETSNVDAEVATVAGPQLVVPALNARFAANAANARWGSLYDALYGTDAIPQDGELAPGSSYNPARGAAVIARARAVLDDHFPLHHGSHVDATQYAVDDLGLHVTLREGTARLADPAQFVGHRSDDPGAPEAVLLRHHGLHVEIQVDREHQIGKDDAAGVKDLLVESAVSTIIDLEDSVAAVDADDKVLGYRTWLELMRGTLTAEVSKGGRTFTRGLEPDRTYIGPKGELDPSRSVIALRAPGRSPHDHRRGAPRRRRRRPPRGSSTRSSPHCAASSTSRSAASSATPAPARCTR